MSDIILFHFEQSEVRYVGDGVNHEWVAQDVFEAMGLKWDANLIAEYDETEAGTTLIRIRSENGAEQERQVRTLKQPGLWTAMLRSRNAMKAGTVQYRFRKWITAKVIPSIQKTGEYSIEKEKLERQFLPDITAQNRIDALKILKVGCHDKVYIQRTAIQQARKICPDIEAPLATEMASLPTTKALLNASKIAVELGVFCKSNTESGDARWVNKKLEELGYQEKISGQWSATSKSEGLTDRKPVETGSRTQKDQLLWSADILPILQEHCGLSEAA